MNFNFKESINKIKKEKLKYEVDRDNLRFQKEFQTKLYNTNYNFYKNKNNETNENKEKETDHEIDEAEKNNIENSIAFKKILPKVESGNYILPLKIKPEIDRRVEYIRKNIRKIVNVYQKEYNNNVKATGFGDFIRGTYFIMQFCERYKIKCDVQLNHPFRKYLKLYSKIPDLNLDVDLDSDLKVNFFEKNNFHPGDNEMTNENEEIIDDFINYLKEQTFESKVARVYVISFNFAKITEQQKNCMRSLLEPTDDFKCYILSTLKNMQLVFKKYIVIHIRSGDNMLIHNEDVNNEYLRNILSEIYNIYKPQYKYLVLSDSISLKEKIVNLFPEIRAEFKEITHSGEGVTLASESVKNTMLDFYLLAYSGRIFAYSCYDHGSGFSRWCAETFNIPYKCTIVK